MFSSSLSPAQFVVLSDSFFFFAWFSLSTVFTNHVILLGSHMIYAHITEQYTYNRQAYIQRIYSVNTSIYIYQVTVETYQYNTICKYNEQTTPCKNVNL